MARVGLANFSISTGESNLHDATWREALNREQWDHLYHAMRVDDPKRKYSYRNAQTEGKEKLSKTWHIMNQVYSSAAGQGSYHYNLQKPVGNVQAYFPSASFHLLPRHVRSKESALFENGGLVHDHSFSRKHLENHWAQTGNNARYGGGVWSGEQDKQRAFRGTSGSGSHRQKSSRNRATQPRTLGYDKSVYNEAHYNEGLYNSDSLNKHDQTTIDARYSELRGEPRTKVMSKTYSEGFFRDAHGEDNANRNAEVYDSTVGRFDKIRDNVSSAPHSKRKDFIDAEGDPTLNRGRTTGPFFHATKQANQTANRSAGGALTEMVRRSRHQPPRYFMSTQDHPAPRVRRTNHLNAPSFQRVVAV